MKQQNRFFQNGEKYLQDLIEGSNRSGSDIVELSSSQTFQQQQQVLKQPRFAAILPRAYEEVTSGR